MAQPSRQPLGASGANASAWAQAAFGSPGKVHPDHGEDAVVQQHPQPSSEHKQLARDALAVIQALEAEVGRVRSGPQRALALAGAPAPPDASCCWLQPLRHPSWVSSPAEPAAPRAPCRECWQRT